MKTLITRCTVLLLALAFSPAEAVEFVWPGHGPIAFDVPANWTMHGAPTGDAGYYFMGKPNSETAAMLQITLGFLPTDRPAASKDSVKSQLEKIVGPFLAGSEEKKFSPTALKLHQGFGWYAQLTDSNLVGKPPVAGDFKVMRNAFASLEARAMAVITMQFDDPGGAAPVEMLRIVESMKLQRERSDALQFNTTGTFYELKVPQSRLTLKIPVQGLAVQYERDSGGSTSNPRYFQFKGTDSGLMASGWFEPASRYDGLQKLWKGDTAAWKRAGSPEPINVRFDKLNGWELIEYDIALDPRASNSHLRAELTRAGTWVDLHVSITSERSTGDLHAELRKFLQSLVVDGN